MIATVDALALTVAVAAPPFAAADPAALVVAGLAVLAVAGSYRSRIVLSALDDFPRLLIAALVVSLAVVLVPSLSSGSTTPFGVLAVVAGALTLGRVTAYVLIRRLRRSSALTRRAVIVGAGSVGRELHAVLGQHPEYGISSRGIVDDVPPEDALPLLGGISAMGDALDATRADVVVVAFGPTGEQELVSVLRAIQDRCVDLLIVPRFFELGLAPSGPDVETIWGIPLYHVRRSALSRWNWPVKRSLDVLAASLLLMVAAPLMLAVTVAVRASSPGPILFRQHRVGQHGRTIEVLKFRTMRINDDSDTTWNVVEDPRVTPVGKWLRRLSLDELPQLLNVLRGDMSMVGPRPERPHFVDRFSQEVAGYPDRHRVPAGLTGLAQIHGLRGDTSIVDRARFDNAYVEHWTPWLDLKIVLRTVTAVIRDALRTPSTPEVEPPVDLRSPDASSSADPLPGSMEPRLIAVES